MRLDGLLSMMRSGLLADKTDSIQRSALFETMAQAWPSIFGNGRIPTDTLHLKGKIFLFFELPRELRDVVNILLILSTYTNLG